jgi:hypothetical protein
VFGTSIVPVTPLGTGLTPGDVAGGGNPLGPTGAPGADPSEEVTPSGGVSMPTWASAGLQHSKGKVVATKKDLMDDFPNKSGRTAQRAAARTAVGRAAWTTFFFMVSSRSEVKIVSSALRERMTFRWWSRSGDSALHSPAEYCRS